MDDLTNDGFFNGEISVRQDRDGYRFSIDSVLLAYHAGLTAQKTVLDLGTGCGIIPLIMAIRNPELEIRGIEIQPRLAEIAALNAKENRMEDRIRILCADMKTLRPEMFESFADTVVSNPPYRRLLSGRTNPHSQKAIARHEIRASLSDVAEAAKRMLPVSGRFVIIYPAERTADLLTQMRHSRIEPKFVRFVHSFARDQAKLILAEGIRGAGPGVKIGSPLVIYREDGTYGDEMAEMFVLRRRSCSL